MNWLRDRIRGRKPQHEKPTEQRAERSHRPGGPRPRLMLLVHDAAGPGAYRLHTFEDAASAEAFVQFWFPPRFHHGILAFWATHGEPVQQSDADGGAPAEAVILIRDEVRPGIVYPFSLSDMSMAHPWIAKEATRGLKLRQVLLYWAMPVRIGVDHWGRVRVTPREPPAVRRGLLLRSSTVVVHKDATPRREDHVWPERANERRRGSAGITDPADADTAGDAPDGAPGVDVSEILEEVERLIQRRRRRRMRGEEPFRGFGSPPGKF